jgi:hypothetical protein
VRSVVRIPVAPHLFGGNIEGEDDAGGSRETGGQHLVMQGGEVRPFVGSHARGQIGREIEAEQLESM